MAFVKMQYCANYDKFTLQIKTKLNKKGKALYKGPPSKYFVIGSKALISAYKRLISIIRLYRKPNHMYGPLSVEL